MYAYRDRKGSGKLLDQMSLGVVLKSALHLYLTLSASGWMREGRG